MQFEFAHKQGNYLSNPKKASEDHPRVYQTGLAVAKEYRSSQILEPYSYIEQETQLDVLIHCQKCHRKFKQPTTLSCGFTLCSHCLPSSEPYQCHSFSCLRTHANHDYKPNVLLENILYHYEQNQYEAIKGLLDCSICLSPLTQPITTQCGHTFCKDCLIQTMTDLSCKACPFCRQPLSRIGKVNQIISGWLAYIYHHDPSNQPEIKPDQAEIRHIPILQVTNVITFPTQHCIIHVTKDPKGLLRQMEAKPYQRHHIICVFPKPDNTYPPSLHDHGMMLQINHLDYSPDTRHAVIQAVGVFRLKLDCFTLDPQDDYYTGDIYRLDDTSDVDDLDDMLVEPSQQKQRLSPLAIRSPLAQPTTSTSMTFKLPNKTATRPRSCSIRLSSSAPTTPPFSVAENYTPGSTNRKAWATLLQLPYSPAVVDHDNNNSRQVYKIPNFITAKINASLATEDSLLEELSPRIKQFLETLSDHVRSMQYDWYLQQSDRVALVWWIANILPLPQEQKIYVLRTQSLKERMLALIHLIDNLSR